MNTNNQIVGVTYDAAGNLTSGEGGTYAYNTENQLCALGTTNCNSPGYIYDGDGNRVEKSGSKIYWYAGSEVLDETDATGSVTNSNFNEYVFFGGNRIARRDSSGDVFYYMADQIGSSRVIAEVPSGQTTATMCYDGDFEPYGGEHAYINSCPQNYKFTGKERDAESNLDNFGARYYASTTGRFMSPDWALKPISVPYANFGDPQTLNLYTYVENSPLDRIDADGHCTDERGGGCDGSPGTDNGGTPSNCNEGGPGCPPTSTTSSQANQSNPAQNASGTIVRQNSDGTFTQTHTDSVSSSVDANGTTTIQRANVVTSVTSNAQGDIVSATQQVQNQVSIAVNDKTGATTYSTPVNGPVQTIGMKQAGIAFGGALTTRDPVVAGIMGAKGRMDIYLTATELARGARAERNGAALNGTMNRRLVLDGVHAFVKAFTDILD